MEDQSQETFNLHDKNLLEYEYELWKSKNGELELQLLQATSRGPKPLEREREKERCIKQFVRLNVINHLVGFIPCQICLYFNNQ